MKAFWIALRALQAYKTRTVFAILGVFFGALVLNIVLNTAEAMVEKTRRELDKLGPNLITATAGALRFDSRGNTVALEGTIQTFTLKDYEEIYKKNNQYIQTASPFINAKTSIRYHNILLQNNTLIASYPTYQYVRSLPIAYGRFFTEKEEDDKDKVVVLGYNIAKELFTSAKDAVGKTVRLDKTVARVVGVVQEIGQSTTGSRLDEYIYIPLSTYMRRITNQNHITGVYLSLRSLQTSSHVEESINTILRKNHFINNNNDDDFVVFTAEETIKLQSNALALVNSLAFLAACISFAIGGLSILSIMILLVRSRTTEIGIKRAIGATKYDIIIQFLLESCFMSTLGALLGSTVAYILLIPIYQIGNFPFVYNIFVLSSTCITSLLIGFLAGIYPAWQASKMDILYSLQSYNS
ncbi:MAG: ABC transporter permease [Desulfovibrionaceae bacterium]